MANILIKKVELNNTPVDILIEGEYIKRIAESIQVDDAIIIDGSRKAVIPGLINLHTHAAMTLFRGCCDDIPLMRWLKEEIWPREAKLTHEDVYWGARLACLEMIKSGTTTFVDSYHFLQATAQATEDAGLRAVLSGACFDNFDQQTAEHTKENIIRHTQSHPSAQTSSRITFAIAPHAIYTVSAPTLQWIDHFSKEHNLLIQMHLAETESEVAYSLKNFKLSPVRYLHSLGILSPRLLIAHALYIDDDEIQILADQGVNVAHNPASNMKLASGHSFPFVEMRKAGIPVGIGTDGCSSSNNLDMIEAMKLSSLLGKSWRKDPEAIPAAEAFHAATTQGADILGLKSGRVEEGYLADISLIDLNIPAFTPNLNFVSNLVYAANGSCVDTLICNGKILMQGKKVDGEDQILQQVSQRAQRLCK